MKAIVVSLDRWEELFAKARAELELENLRDEALRQGRDPDQITLVRRFNYVVCNLKSDLEKT